MSLKYAVKILHTGNIQQEFRLDKKNSWPNATNGSSAVSEILHNATVNSRRIKCCFLVFYTSFDCLLFSWKFRPQRQLTASQFTRNILTPY